MPDDEPIVIDNQDFAVVLAGVMAMNATFRFEVHGSSMNPFIHNGDWVTLAPLPARLGDVVAAHHPVSGALIVHRVVVVSAEGYVLRGDNVRMPDGLVRPEGIIGRVIKVEHRQRPVWVGAGVERLLIAWLSRRGWLIPLIGGLRRVFGPVYRKFWARGPGSN